MIELSENYRIKRILIKFQDFLISKTTRNTH